MIWFWLEPKDELIDYEFKDDSGRGLQVIGNCDWGNYVYVAGEDFLSVRQKDQLLFHKMTRKTTVIAAGKKRRAAEEKTKTFKIAKKRSEQIRSRSQVSTKEIVNIVADTVEKIYLDFGEKIDRVNAEDKALIISRYIIHGIGGGAIVTPPKIREKNLKAPLCKGCK